MSTLAIMPTYMSSKEHLEYTLRAIQTLKKTSDLDLLVIDDGSPYKQGVAALAAVGEGPAGVKYETILNYENRGFAATVNVGLRKARKSGQNALLVNADLEFISNGWFGALEASDGDVVGGMLLYPNGLVQHAGIYFSVIARRFDHMYRLSPRTLAQVQVPQICPVTGALQLIRHSTLEKVGIYDENFRLGFEDIDYCHEVFKAGLKCVYQPAAQAIHHESVFRKPSSQEHEAWWQQSWEYLHEKHAGLDFSASVPTMLEWPE
jgi:GT2 family glycosyltransferase